MNSSLFYAIVLTSIVSCQSTSLKRLFGPIHASCNIDWNFGISCNETSQKIVAQMVKWGEIDCGTSEKCLYKLKSKNETTLLATHTTPVKKYVDDLTFTLKPQGQSCQVHGFSTSETWYAVLDYGTNYCNLHNLIAGAGLDKTNAYSEKTDDSVCTQYSSADCDKY